MSQYTPAELEHLNHLWEVALQLEHGVRRIEHEKNTLEANGYRAQDERYVRSLVDAVQRGTKDAEAVRWAIRKLTGQEEPKPPPEVSARFRRRMLLVD